MFVARMPLNAGSAKKFKFEISLKNSSYERSLKEILKKIDISGNREIKTFFKDVWDSSQVCVLQSVQDITDNSRQSKKYAITDIILP